MDKKLRQLLDKKIEQRIRQIMRRVLLTIVQIFGYISIATGIIMTILILMEFL